jgi:uncharacterized protein YPO0396
MTTSTDVSQFWLSRLQVINWGVFDNYHDIRFSRRGTLITGSSGSGKSSLLDAISLAFLSSARRNFNASSDVTAAGSSIGRRTVDKYVRGLWGELQNPGERPKQMFLRGKGATWSAVAVTYTGTDSTVITGLVLKWLAAGADTDAASFYFLIDQDADIRELCNEWVAKGHARAVFENAGWKGKPHENWYLDRLYATIGIQGSTAALHLLGKAKSLKSVGGLEQFVREYMLDEPESLTGIHDALNQITPLVEARNALAVAQRKRHTLGDIEEIQQIYASDAAQLATVDIIDHQMVRDWVDEQRRASIGPEVELLDAEIARLGAECEEIKTQQAVLTGERDKLTARIAAADSNLAPLRAELSQAHARAEEVSRHRIVYDQALWDLGYPAAETADDFESMRAESLAAVARVSTELDSGKDVFVEAAGRLSAARDQAKAASDELKRVERIGTATPPDEDRMRGEITAALGVTAKQLPYVCELMDLRDGHDRWRRAVEKVLRSTGLVLLVPGRYHRNVLRYVDEHNMRGLLRIEHVTTDGPTRHPTAGTLAECLKLTDHGHECATTAVNLIATVGDYVRVDSTEDFRQHRRAVTAQGLRKENERRAIKDDRADLRVSQYIFQGNIDDKIAALRQELLEAQQVAETAEQEVSDLHAKRQDLQDELLRWSKLHSQFEQFSQVDTHTADVAVARLQDQYDALLADNPDLTELQRQADDFLEAISALSERVGALKKQESEYDSRRTRLLELAEALKPGEVGAHSRAGIEAYLPYLSSKLDVLDSHPYQLELWRLIEKDQSTLRESVRRSRNDLTRIIALYDREFPDAIPNDSADLDEKVHDYVALCRRIDERDLPAAYDRMLRLITEQAPTAVLRLHQLAEEEAQRIEHQIARVNIGLGSVEFNRGTRLTLHADPKHLTAVADLNERARRISRRAVTVSMGDEKAIHDQYQEILQLRNLLASDSAEARQWTRDALDVRNRFVLYCAERDANNGELIRTHSNAGANSGGEQEKLMAFCLAGALSFNLANPDTGDNRPVFSQLMLDEAFSKSDPVFAQQALSAFRKFGFQLVIVATVQNTTTIQPYIESVVMVSKPDTPGATPIASTYTVTISEFVDIRQELAASPAPAG